MPPSPTTGARSTRGAAEDVAGGIANAATSAGAGSGFVAGGSGGGLAPAASFGGNSGRTGGAAGFAADDFKRLVRHSDTRSRPNSKCAFDALQLAYRKAHTHENKPTHGSNGAWGNNFGAENTLGKNDARCGENQTSCRDCRPQNQQKQCHNCIPRPYDPTPIIFWRSSDERARINTSEVSDETGRRLAAALCPSNTVAETGPLGLSRRNLVPPRRFYRTCPPPGSDFTLRSRTNGIHPTRAALCL